MPRSISYGQGFTSAWTNVATFVPKLVVAALVLVLTGAWCLRTLEGFTREIFAMVPTLLNS